MVINTSLNSPLFPMMFTPNLRRVAVGLIRHIHGGRFDQHSVRKFGTYNAWSIFRCFQTNAIKQKKGTHNEYQQLIFTSLSPIFFGGYYQCSYCLFCNSKFQQGPFITMSQPSWLLL